MDDRGYPSTSNGSRLNHARDPWQKWSWLVPVVVVAALAVAYVLLKGPLRDSQVGGGVADAELDVEAFEEDAPDGAAGESGELGTAVDVPAEDAPLTPDEPTAVDAAPVESGDSSSDTPEADGAEDDDGGAEKAPVESPSK